MLAASYDYRLVALSVFIAVVAAYAALDLAGRINSARGRARLVWLAGGAIAMGIGMWSMHYIGMVAYRLPIHVRYHLPTVLVSLIAGIAASYVALFVVTRPLVRALHLGLGALLMGSGIAAMHYIGMAAMRLAAMHHYDPPLWTASIGLAVLISFVALWLTPKFREDNRRWHLKLGASLLLGLAIPAMHYTGMAAVSFMPSDASPDMTHAVDISVLANATILLFTFLILGFVLLASFIGRRLSAQERQLALSHQRYLQLFDSNPQPMIAFDLQALNLFAANRAAAQLYGYATEELLAMKIDALHAADEMERLIDGAYSGMSVECQHRRKDGAPIQVKLCLRPIAWNNRPAALAIVADLTDRNRARLERDSMEVQLRHSQKLESIGQLAAGIAHEINTPMQYIGDNTRFLDDTFKEIRGLLEQYSRLLGAAQSQTLTPELIAEIAATVAAIDTQYLLGEIPKAIHQSLEGVERVTTLVLAMKEFSHPGTKEKVPVDLNRAVQSTITIARNEWKYVSDVLTIYDRTLPPVPCLPGEFNQVILNLLVNAAHAIADVVGDGSQGKGKITIRTRRVDDYAEITVQDTGTGIPEKARDRIFDPFFTTKEVGRGTGQGLAIAHSVIVDKHGGSIRFETQTGRGTTFIIRLPLDPKPQPETKVLA